jgi:histidine ammonia-lyase
MQITGEGLKVENIFQVAYSPEKPVTLAPSAMQKMKASRDYIEGRIQAGETMYGVNTGFGAFSSVRISDTDIEKLQKNLIRSHSAGVGEPFTKAQTRAMMLLRANALARGHSGIRVQVVEKVLEYLNKDIIPVIPCQGSVGASGDLAPLSHLALALIGEGEVWEPGAKAEKYLPVQVRLKSLGVTPLELKAKEGLSLINGCQVMTALGALGLYEARNLAWLADLSGAMSLEALKGSRSAFDPLISAVRPHPGESKTARNLLKILGPDSGISRSHENCDKVQDAYSLRCMPAVHGAVKDTLRYAAQVLETEANSSTDNPLVFSDDNKILSCGNFHGEPVAFALDFLGIAISSLANISECRLTLMINPSMSGLPAFLTNQGGLNSGHMIVQVAAASLVSENKILAHPASVDSLPTSADKEDHVSMGTIAARKFLQILKNAQNVIAMEMLSACQALDLIKPLKPAAGVAVAYEIIRKTVPYASEDRVFAKDIDCIREMILDQTLIQGLQKQTGDLEW